MPERSRKTPGADHVDRLLDALQRVTQDLINRHELDEILDRLLLQCASLLEAPSVSIDLLEGEDVIVTRAATPGQPLTVGDRMRRGEGGFLTWQAIDSGKPAVLDDYSAWSKRRALYDEFPIRAILIIPMLHQGQPVGTINFLRFEAGRTFSEADMYVAERLAQAAALAIDNARVYAELRRELDERRRAEEALSRAQFQMLEKEQAMAALRERERLARDLHDGLGQILGAMSMQSDILIEFFQKNELESARQTLVKLNDAIQQANQTIRENISGLIRATPSESREDFFSALRNYCRHTEEEYRFKIKLALPDNPPDPLASAEVETHLTYIVREALNNARKYSGVHEARVAIEVDAASVTARVEDRGRGLPPSRSGEEEHFGIGIMRSRAREVGGSLRIDTVPASGTSINVRLPRRLWEASLTRMRILLADDHPLFADGLRSMLLLRGAPAVELARDGIEALEKARTWRPDVILMDIHMPRMNGLEATSVIKAELPETRIVMLTAASEEQELFAALRAGAAGYLLKAMDADEFLSLLGEICMGQANLSPEIAAQILRIFDRPGLQTSPTRPRDQLDVLTDRQREVIGLVAQGLTYKEVGTRLFLTERTVKFHMGEILKRMQVKDRRELLSLAKRSQDGAFTGPA